MAEYATSTDIVNKALQHLGCPLITSITALTKNAVNMNFAYDKCRQAELRAHIWNFSIAYANLRPAPTPTQTFQNGETRNRFAMPSGYARLAAQDPHYQGISNQGSSGGVQWTDYSIEAGTLLTASTSVILRYAMDATAVPTFDALFCESVAARIAFDTCEVITQSLQKRAQISEIYTQRIAEARRMNLIEAGTDEPLEAEVDLIRINRGLPPQQQQQRGR